MQEYSQQATAQTVLAPSEGVDGIRSLVTRDSVQTTLQLLLALKLPLRADAVFAALDREFPVGTDPRTSTLILSGLAKRGSLDMALIVPWMCLA